MTTLDQFSKLVEDIYDAALDPSLWEQTLKRVVFAAGGNAGALHVFGRRQGRRQFLIPANLDPVQIRKYDEYYGRIDPVASAMERTRVGVIVTARAVTTERQRRGEFYSDWAHPNELGDAVFGNLLDSTDGVCALAIANCLVPRCAGVIYAKLRREGLWDKFYMDAPARQRQCVEQYNIVKRA